MRAPCGERPLHPARPHGRMRRSADVAKEVGTPGLGIEGRRSFPVEPADVVLLDREKQRLSQRFGPGANRRDIVADPFLGSGSTLIAADKTGRICRGVELDPLYVDVIVRRYEAVAGGPAVLVETGEAFDLLAKRRSGEAAPA